MNFFSHCHVAAWTRDDAAFALGTMLPDFATMSGSRLKGSSDGDVQAGIDHHHETDAVFHAAPTFVRLCTESAERMEAGDTFVVVDGDPEVGGHRAESQHRRPAARRDDRVGDAERLQFGEEAQARRVGLIAGGGHPPSLCMQPWPTRHRGGPCGGTTTDARWISERLSVDSEPHPAGHRRHTCLPSAEPTERF